jgi:hypothetical protein
LPRRRRRVRRADPRRRLQQWTLSVDGNQLDQIFSGRGSARDPITNISSWRLRLPGEPPSEIKPAIEPTLKREAERKLTVVDVLLGFKHIRDGARVFGSGLGGITLALTHNIQNFVAPVNEVSEGISRE